MSDPKWEAAKRDARIRRRLAHRMLEWEELQDQLRALEDEISESVLHLGETQTIGNTRASYYSGRRKLDYETPGSTAPEEVIEKYSDYESFTDWEALARAVGYTPPQLEQHTATERIVKWDKVCKEAKLEPVVLEQGEPYVKITLLVKD